MRFTGTFSALLLPKYIHKYIYIYKYIYTLQRSTINTSSHTGLKSSYNSSRDVGRRRITHIFASSDRQTQEVEKKKQWTKYRWGYQMTRRWRKSEKNKKEEKWSSGTRLTSFARTSKTALPRYKDNKGGIFKVRTCVRRTDLHLYVHTKKSKRRNIPEKCKRNF